jgi:hypothetical protein
VIQALQSLWLKIYFSESKNAVNPKYSNKKIEITIPETKGLPTDLSNTQDISVLIILFRGYYMQ